MPTLTTQQITAHVKGVLVAGPADMTISGIETLDRAGADQLSFIRSEPFVDAWLDSKAGVVLVGEDLELPDHDRAVIVVADADLALNMVLDLFAPPALVPAIGIHSTAQIDPSVTLGEDVVIGPHCVIGPNVQIGHSSVLHNSVHIQDQSTVGAHCELYCGVVIRERCTIGQHVIIHSNAVIGADGFGYRPSDDGRSAVKIPHIGTVEIGDHVEIGANTCIDRGKFSATRIGAGTKIDNLCQIAHNCEIGQGCLIAAQVGIAGTVTIGHGVQIGGQTGFRDNITIGDGVKLGGCSAVMNDIPAGETWAGVPAREFNLAKREHVAIRQLPGMLKKYKEFMRKFND